MKSPAEIERAFYKAVNMTAEELDEWLSTPESKKVGFVRSGATESVGHASGRRIVQILKRGPHGSDLKHMQKVVGYVRRHLAQRPKGDVSKTRWRYSLMNWGHDPLA